MLRNPSGPRRQVVQATDCAFALVFLQDHKIGNQLTNTRAASKLHICRGRVNNTGYTGRKQAKLVFTQWVLPCYPFTAWRPFAMTGLRTEMDATHGLKSRFEVATKRRLVSGTYLKYIYTI